MASVNPATPHGEPRPPVRGSCSGWRPVRRVPAALGGLLAILPLTDAAHAPAQDTGTPDPAPTAPPSTRLSARRTAFETESLRIALAENEEYLEALIALETKAASERDYRTAIAVRDERERVERAINRLAAESDTPGLRSPIALGAEDLRRSEGVKSDAANPAAGIHDWTGSAAFAEWMLPAPPIPGAHEVAIEYVLESPTPIRIAVREQQFLLTGELEPGGSASDPRHTVIGHLRLRAESTTIRCSIDQLPEGATFRLVNVHLVPPSPPAGAD